VHGNCFCFHFCHSLFYQNSTDRKFFEGGDLAFSEAGTAKKALQSLHFSLPKHSTADFRFTCLSTCSSGLKIHRWRQRTGSSPVTGTNFFDPDRTRTDLHATSALMTRI